MSAIALAAAAAFNLVCTGNQIFKVGDKERHPFKHVLRVDLDAKRWCENDCAQTKLIQEVRERDIIFEADPRSTISGALHMVNRESGSYIYRLVDDRKLLVLFTGTCVPAAFTGFPTRRF